MKEAIFFDAGEHSGFCIFKKYMTNGGDSACPPEPPLRFCDDGALPFREISLFQDISPFRVGFRRGRIKNAWPTGRGI
jgi:hypothetical protein